MNSIKQAIEEFLLNDYLKDSFVIPRKQKNAFQLFIILNI